VYQLLGFIDLKHVIHPKWYATENFHGHYYLDSDVLEQYLSFRNDSMDYFYGEYIKSLGMLGKIIRLVCKFPGGQRLMGFVIKQSFLKEAQTEHGTVRFIKENMEAHIDAYWGSINKWESLPDDINEMEIYDDWDVPLHLEHGYDESKPEGELQLTDMKEAAKFRGGLCLSTSMTQGDWRGKLTFTCTFGHHFEASPRLILEGGHWCPVCERTSWNYAARAKVDPFFAQVWYPLHKEGEKEQEYPKIVSELNI